MVFCNDYRYGINIDLRFGVVGLLVFERLRKGIHDKYPLMQSNFQQRGMTSFLRDMPIEVDLDKRIDEGVLRGRWGTRRLRHRNTLTIRDLEQAS